MKMERGDVSVALVMMAGLIITVSTVFWLTRPDDDYFALFVRLDRVEGLDEQTAVRLFGFPVGRIERIIPQMTSTGLVDFRVELRIEEEFLADSALFIPMGTIARVNFPPIVGAAFIVLEAPEAGGAPLPFGGEIRGLSAEPFLDSFQSVTEEISDAVTETLTRTVALMDYVEGTLSRVDQTVTVAESGITEMLDAVSANLEATERLTLRIESEIDSIAPALRATVDSATVVLADVSRVLDTVDQMVGTTSPELEAILMSLDSATQRLNFFVTRISERPLRLLTGVGAPPTTIDP